MIFFLFGRIHRYAPEKSRRYGTGQSRVLKCPDVYVQHLSSLSGGVNEVGKSGEDRTSLEVFDVKSQTFGKARKASQANSGGHTAVPESGVLFLKFGLEFGINDLIDLDAILEIERAVPPGSAQLVECQAVGIPLLQLHKLHEVAC